MGATQVPAIGGSLNNWELISTASTGGASTLSFTSISGYQSLKVVWSSTAFNESLSHARINADSSNNYAYSGTTGNTDVGTSQYTSRAISSNAYYTFDWTILNCNNVNLKTYTVNAYTSFGLAINATGFYLASAAVTSLDFAWTSGISGAVRLYGVKL
jgi:hypothetical protein